MSVASFRVIIFQQSNRRVMIQYDLATAEQPRFEERFQFILRLWPYTVPLFWVYASEYLKLVEADLPNLVKKPELSTILDK